MNANGVSSIIRDIFPNFCVADWSHWALDQELWAVYHDEIVIELDFLSDEILVSVFGCTMFRETLPETTEQLRATLERARSVILAKLVRTQAKLLPGSLGTWTI